MGASTDGAGVVGGVHGWGLGDAVVAPLEAKSLNQLFTVEKRVEGSESGDAAIRESRSGWREVGQIM